MEWSGELESSCGRVIVALILMLDVSWGIGALMFVVSVVLNLLLSRERGTQCVLCMWFVWCWLIQGQLGCARGAVLTGSGAALLVMGVEIAKVGHGPQGRGLVGTLGSCSWVVGSHWASCALLAKRATA